MYSLVPYPADSSNNIKKIMSGKDRIVGHIYYNIKEVSLYIEDVNLIEFLINNIPADFEYILLYPYV